MKTLSALAILGISGCAAQYYPCQVPDGWQALSTAPANMDDVLANSEQGSVSAIRYADKIEWFGRSDGSLLACLPGEVVGSCGHSKFFRDNACGQGTYTFSKAGESWAKAEWLGSICTCDKKVK